MSSACAIKLGSALVLAAVVAGCSDLYTDRRTRIDVSAGDAIAANKLTHMIDPWPRVSANRNIAFDGGKMQSAVERYRTNRVTNPANGATSSVAPTNGKP
jgi:hypothetical protein